MAKRNGLRRLLRKPPAPRCALIDVPADSAFTHRDMPLVLKNNIVAFVRVTLGTMGFSRVSSWNRIASEQIHARSYRLKVLWVYAKSVFTKMVELQALRNLSNMDQIREPVGVQPIERRLAHNVLAVSDGRVLFVSHSDATRPHPTSLCFLHMLQKQRFVVLKPSLFHSTDCLVGGVA